MSGDEAAGLAYVVEADASARLGEGPVWDPGLQALLWVDIPEGHLHLSCGGIDRVIAKLEEPLSAVALTSNAGLILAASSGLYLTDRYGKDGIGDLELICALPTDGGRRWPNDSSCDPGGRFWLGICAEDDTSQNGVLVKIDRDGSLNTVLEGMTIPNGPAWSTDGRSMWFVESTRRTLYRYDYDVQTGTICHGAVVACFEPSFGVPDGLAVDVEDHIWLAFYGEGAVRRLTPEGQVTCEVRLPTPEVTSCCFGGCGLDTLYVTSGDWDRRRGPHAGSLFSLRPTVPGVAPATFRTDDESAI